MMLGAICAALACFAALQSLRGPAAVKVVGRDLIRESTLSPVEWRLYRQAKSTWYQRWFRPTVLECAGRFHLRPVRLDPNFLTQAGVDGEQFDAVELRTLRIMAGVGGTAIGAFLGIVVAGTPILAPILGWLGFIMPMRILAGLRQRRQAAILRDLPQFIGMARAFLASGMSLERTLHALSPSASADTVLKQEIRSALGRYGLGVSIDHALEGLGPRTGVDDLAMFVSALNQSKRAGTGLDTVLRDHELMARMNQRNRLTAQAAGVGTKLLGVLAGVYLPEFVILIVIPLFWGIMQRAFGSG